jgi:hypothetical protein
MAAGAWVVFNEAKRQLLNGQLDLDGATLKMYLCKVAASLSNNLTLSVYSQLGNFVSGGGYTGAKTLSSVSVRMSTVGTAVFDCADVIFTASGADVTSITYAVIAVSGSEVLCFSRLSSSAFSVTSGNTLTVQINAGGIFQLV